MFQINIIFIHDFLINFKCIHITFKKILTQIKNIVKRIIKMSCDLGTSFKNIKMKHKGYLY